MTSFPEAFLHFLIAAEAEPHKRLCKAFEVLESSGAKAFLPIAWGVVIGGLVSGKCCMAACKVRVDVIILMERVVAIGLVSGAILSSE